MDKIYRLIEVYAGRLSNWAWKKKVKPISQAEWTKGYRKWKKNESE